MVRAWVKISSYHDHYMPAILTWTVRMLYASQYSWSHQRSVSWIFSSLRFRPLIEQLWVAEFNSYDKGGNGHAWLSKGRRLGKGLDADILSTIRSKWDQDKRLDRIVIIKQIFYFFQTSADAFDVLVFGFFTCWDRPIQLLRWIHEEAYVRKGLRRISPGQIRSRRRAELAK